jgi:hypothetical protein
MAPAQPATPLPAAPLPPAASAATACGGGGVVRCLDCGESLLLTESGMSMSCPHSVWLCTTDIPPALSGRVTVGPFARPPAAAAGAAGGAASGTQCFRTPRLTSALDCHIEVKPDTVLLWNADLSLRLDGNCRVVVEHCMRNLQVRIDGVAVRLLRGTFGEAIAVAARPRFISVLAPGRVANKPGPCRLLGLRPFDADWLLSEPFQFFTHPMLNPAFSTDESRGILVGTRPAVAGFRLKDIVVARRALQCTRCRHVWPVRSKHDHANMEGFIHNCGVFGLFVGHLQPVVDTALSIEEYCMPPPAPPPAAQPAAAAAVAEAHQLIERWRRLPLAAGPEALELPGVCLVVGDLGLLDVDCASDLPLASRAELQSALVQLRCLDQWQKLPAAHMCYRHLDTGVSLCTRTCYSLLFFKYG